jgi:hypothetical protein
MAAEDQIMPTAEAKAPAHNEPSRRLLEAHFKFGHLSLQGLSELHRHELLPGVTAADLRAGFGTWSNIKVKRSKSYRNSKSKNCYQTERRSAHCAQTVGVNSLTTRSKTTAGTSI